MAAINQCDVTPIVCWHITYASLNFSSHSASTLLLFIQYRVPSTSIGRAFGFAGMGASLLFGSITDSISNAFSGNPSNTSNSNNQVYSSIITESNAERLANALCRMRGAALKVGQMLSIQDETVLPPQIQAALERVRAGADVMPRGQVEGQLKSELGKNWQTKVAEFDFQPRAAASIGQVHAATLHDGRQVAMKIQYPGKGLVLGPLRLAMNWVLLLQSLQM